MNRLYKPESHEEFDIFAELLTEYIKELHQLESNVELRDKEQLIEEYFYMPDTDLYLLLSSDNSVVGFAIIGHGINCHPDVDIYIEEFYIKPEYRRQGYASSFAEEIVGHVDSVCFFELKTNTSAKALWNKVFDDWIDLSKSIKDTSNAPEWLDWYVFKRKDNK